MIGTCLRSGWRASLGRPRLLLTLWFWNALMGLVVAMGMSRWLTAAFGWSPVADQTLERFRMGLLVELTQYDRFSPFTFAAGVVWALVLIAALSNALISAGVLEVLTSGDNRPLLHRFFRGAGHFFGRFLRLLIITGVALLLIWIIVGALTRPIVSALGESSWERTWIAAGLLRFAVLGALVALLMAVLDIARAQVATAPVEQRGMLRAWWKGARALFRHFGTVAAIYLVLGLCWVVLALVGLAIVFAVTPTSWAAIAMLILVQQAFMFVRAGIRVARAGAVVELVACRSLGSSGSSGSYGSSGSEVPQVPEVPHYSSVAPTAEPQKEPQEP